MTDQYTFYADLADEAGTVKRGIHSQTISKGDGVEVVLFTLAPGEELSEHTSARPVIVHALRGAGQVTVAGDTHPLAPGAWLRMPGATKHSVHAESELTFALYLLPRQDRGD